MYIEYMFCRFRITKSALMAVKKSKLREWSDLPVEVREMILVRLPVTELARHKVVCKAWRSLISSPDFISVHLKRSKSDPTSHRLLFQQYDTNRDLSRSRPSIVCCLPLSAAIVGSVDGLLCIVEFSLRSENHRIFIMNPVTGYVRKLPPPFESSFHYGSSTFVFWFDSVSRDYKLAIVVSHSCKSTAASLWVSSSPETWTGIRVDFNATFARNHCSVSGCDIVVGDFAYWIVFNGLRYYTDVVELFVLVLDLKALSLKRLPFPLRSITRSFLVDRLYKKDNIYMFAAKWKGKFALVEKGVGDSASSHQTERTYNVWTMDDEEGVWHVQSSFEVDFTFDRCISNINGKSMLMRKLNEYYYGITLYDVETGQVELIKDFKLSYSVQSAYDFVESFVSIKGFITFQDYDSRNPLPVLRPFSMNVKSKKKNG